MPLTFMIVAGLQHITVAILQQVECLESRCRLGILCKTSAALTRRIATLLAAYILKQLSRDNRSRAMRYFAHLYANHSAFRVALIVVMACLIIAGLLAVLPNAHQASNRMLLIECENHIRQIQIAFSHYADRYDGCLPPLDGAAGLRLLYDEGFLKDLTLLICPAAKNAFQNDMHIPFDDNMISYFYRGGSSVSSYNNEAIICGDKPDNHLGTFNVIYSDLSIGTISKLPLEYRQSSLDGKANNR